MTAVEESSVQDRFGLVGRDLDGKFRVERLVAEGGFGVVYAGLHLALDVPVAVKVLKVPPELGANAREAFMDKFVLEAKTIARINHPNIVKVLDTGVSRMPTEETAPWMVLEWLSGEQLEDMFNARRNEGGMSPQDAWRLLRPAFEAIAYAHDEGIAHRDIKPANIMLCTTKRGRIIRLLDFGIAKLMQEGEQVGSGMTATRGSFNAFSPSYAAPEQIAGARTGPWTDVHALGLLMTEALTDMPPYGDGGELTDLFQEVLSPSRPTPAKRGRDVGPVEGVLRKATAYKPEERYQNANELIAALDEAVGQAAGFGAGTTRVSTAAMPANQESPTTLRNSVLTQDVPGGSRKGLGPVIAGVVFAVLALGGGAFWMMQRGGDGTPATAAPAPQTTISAQNPAPAPVAPTPVAPAPAPAPPTEPAAAPAAAAPAPVAANPATPPRPAPNRNPRPRPRPHESGSAGYTLE